MTAEDGESEGAFTTPSFRCPRCEGLLIGDAAADELVCFACSRRFKADGTTTARDHENPGRNHEQIGGIRFYGKGDRRQT